MIKICLYDLELLFETNDYCFSPNDIDKGTAAMLSSVKFQASDKLLDLGCGYGVVGIYAAKIINPANVFMSDIIENAITLAQTNARINQVDGIRIIKSDGFNDMHESGFTLILSNPPYHTDFKTAKHFIEKGFNRLVIGGRFYMVTKRREWYKNKFVAIFGGVKIHEIDGYYIFQAIKMKSAFASSKQ